MRVRFIVELEQQANVVSETHWLPLILQGSEKGTRKLFWLKRQ